MPTGGRSTAGGPPVRAAATLEASAAEEDEPNSREDAAAASVGTAVWEAAAAEEGEMVEEMAGCAIKAVVSRPARARAGAASVIEASPASDGTVAASMASPLGESSFSFDSAAVAGAAPAARDDGLKLFMRLVAPSESGEVVVDELAEAGEEGPDEGGEVADELEASSGEPPTAACCCCCGWGANGFVCSLCGRGLGVAVLFSGSSICRTRRPKGRAGGRTDRLLDPGRDFKLEQIAPHSQRRQRRRMDERRMRSWPEQSDVERARSDERTSAGHPAEGRSLCQRGWAARGRAAEGTSCATSSTPAAARRPPESPARPRSGSFVPSRVGWSFGRPSPVVVRVAAFSLPPAAAGFESAKEGRLNRRRERTDTTRDTRRAHQEPVDRAHRTRLVSRFLPAAG